MSMYRYIIQRCLLLISIFVGFVSFKNMQDNRGSTVLHSLIYKRYDTLALWLVRQGANIHLQDKRGFSPFDNALGWFQKELTGNLIHLSI